MTPTTPLPLAGFLLAGLLLGGCTRPTPEHAPAPTDAPALQDVFGDAFLIGAALNPAQFTERDTVGATLIKRHFNAITPENVMKWEAIHPAPDRYDFEAADRFVAFGEANGMFIVGHTLVWHSQTPRWVFEDAAGGPASRDTLLARMRDHIHTVVGRYRGRVDGWDVVNEALNADGTLRASPWMEIIGEDYLTYAFRFAHEADPAAALYYNDYGLEAPAKRDGAVRLIRRLLDAGVPVRGIGTQAHHHLAADRPSVEAQAAAIEAFAALGIDVMITELDIDVLPRSRAIEGADVAARAEPAETLDPYPDALPDSMQAALAQRYASLFEVFWAHRDAIARVTFWGVRDGDSWLNYWPIRSRTNYPLLFDRAGDPKPAFEAVIETARE